MKLGTRKYEVIETSQTILDDILTGKIRKLENLKKRVENQRKKIYQGKELEERAELGALLRLHAHRVPAGIARLLVDGA